MSIYRLRNRTKSLISSKLTNLKNRYRERGFVIKIIYADNEFDHDTIKDVFPETVFKICAAGEHVPSIERAIRTISTEILMEGQDNPDLNNKRIAFGSYALAYLGTDNKMNYRSTPSIALSESNQTGGNFFMSLQSGKKFNINR